MAMTGRWLYSFEFKREIKLPFSLTCQHRRASSIMLCLGSTLACSAVRKSSLASWTLPNLEWAMALLARICRTKTCLAISFFAVTEKLGLMFLGTNYASRIQHFFTCVYLLLGTWIIIVLTQTLNKLIAMSALQYGHNVQCTCN